jgi:hypothetical protein
MGTTQGNSLCNCLYLKLGKYLLVLSFMFFLLQNQRAEGRNSCNRFCRGGGFDTCGKGKVTGCKQCIHKYVNAKMIPVETLPGIRREAGGREVEGRIQV